MKKLIIFAIIFLIIGAYIITVKNNYNLKDESGDRMSFLKDFSGWVVNIGKNLKDITGLASKQEWLPQDQNATDSVK